MESFPWGQIQNKALFLSISMSHFVPDVALTSRSICLEGCMQEEIAKGTGITIMPLTNLCMWGSFPPAEPRIKSDGCLPGAHPSSGKYTATFARNSLVLWDALSLLCIVSCLQRFSFFNNPGFTVTLNKKIIHSWMHLSIYLLNKDAPTVYFVLDPLLFTENRNRKKK